MLPSEARAETMPRPLSEERATLVSVGALLLLAFLVRLIFINADGFTNDVRSFEAWALTLAAHPPSEFYAKAGFADYPPGYMYVLWFVGHVYNLLIHNDSSYGILKIFVKLPGILMDLVDAVLIFAIVRRLGASRAWGFGAFALFAFNPAAIFVSSYWGQVDSVTAALVLGAVWLVLDAYAKDGRPATIALAGAWILISISILMKPAAIVFIPLLVAFPFTSDDRTGVTARRLIASLIGAGASLFIAYLAAAGFHPGWNPFEQFAWLYGRYQSASAVYPYNSVNAFNLYAMLHHFWENDNQLLLWFPQWAWGVALFLAATALVVSRYVQRRDPSAFVEAGMVLSLGYFILLTRMHERYIFDAFVLAIPLIALRRRYLWAAIVLSLTLLANLFYSLYYLRVMSDKISGVDPTDLLPWLTHPMSVLNVAVFFYLGFVFLGAGTDPIEGVDLSAAWQNLTNPARHWFSPLAGVVAMTRVDWLIAAGMALASFVLTFAWFQVPPEKIFDEIYYARAGEEYLSGKEIFEYTHPPLTKLLIAASMLLFGGMHGAGDTAVGWRFLNLVVGAVMVFVLYIFAKRLLGSTPFAALAAGFLLFDGFHYVQSRIATPEITVAFFSLLTLYAFYRFWIASQVRVAPEVNVSAERIPDHELLGIGAATLLALLLAWLVARHDAGGQQIVGSTFVAVFLYFELGLYLVVRLGAPLLRRAAQIVSYAEGSRWRDAALHLFDGGCLEKKKTSAGESTTTMRGGLLYADDEMRIEYRREGDVRYETPEGKAQFAPDGTMVVVPGLAAIDGRRDARIWMWVLAAACGCLAASKWNGLFDFFVVWVWIGAVASQRFWVPIARMLGAKIARLRPAAWGNPFGFSLDVVVAAMLFGSATIYVLTYIPYFALTFKVNNQIAHHTLTDLISLQFQMYGYHANLTATHPYGSHWWQWPLILKPISYYYHDFRTGALAQNPAACCVAEILALPNPLIWWLGLASVPFVAYLAWR